MKNLYYLTHLDFNQGESPILDIKGFYVEDHEAYYCYGKYELEFDKETGMFNLKFIDGIKDE